LQFAKGDTGEVVRNPYGPDFIGIGVPKAGTTWLDFVLRQHPQVWLPPIKEIHFFDDYFAEESNAGLRRYFSGNDWVKNRWRRNLKAVAKNALRYPSPQKIRWAASFLCRRMSFDWYKGLFPDNGLLRGEITPGYCTIEDDKVEKVHHYFPNAKIILMLRNPIDRAWSHCRMELFGRKNRTSSEVSEEEVHQFLFTDQGVRARSHFSRALAAWMRVYGNSAVFVGLYDDLANDPVRLAQNLFDFLGLSSEFVDLDGVADRRVHEGVKLPMSNQLRSQLTIFCAEEIKRVDALLPGRNVLALWSQG